MTRPRFGIWIVGARGSVSTTTMIGLSALRQQMTDAAGLVTELPIFADLQLASWDEIVVGGHDIRQTPLQRAAEEQTQAPGAIPLHLVQSCLEDLDRWETNIRTGTLFHVGPRIESLADGPMPSRDETPAETIDRLQHDLDEFMRKHNVQRVVVVNLASTEPRHPGPALPSQWSALEPLLRDPSCPLGASSLYAIAALDRGLPYVNFTPSTGACPLAIQELAEARGACHAGCDGKTGETLLKSVLAPMFAQRNLRVMSWVGHNIFGNLDGKVLDAPENKASKVRSKDHLLAEVLGYEPQSLVTIEYIESLREWKTAWDHVHFRGFLGTPMSLQFTWQGCDSLLAAPLVLDLCRLVWRAHEQGERGVLSYLASYFKSPLKVEEHAFAPQFQMLVEWASRTRTKLQRASTAPNGGPRG